MIYLRYIPSRATTDIDLAHYAVTLDEQELSPVKAAYRQQLLEAMNIPQNTVDSKILSYKGNKPKPQEGNDMGDISGLLQNSLALRKKTCLLSCQPSVTFTSCLVYKGIRDLELIEHLCINPILWIGLIHK